MPMRKFSYGVNVSLDGFIAAPEDDIGWSVPGDEPLRDAQRRETQ